MAMQLKKIVELLDKSGYSAYAVETEDWGCEDDEIVIVSSRFGISVDSQMGAYAMLCEYEYDTSGKMVSMIDRGVAESMPQLFMLLTKAGFSLKR
jgi:hypothetical protein